MGHTIAIPHHRPVARERVHPLLRTALLGVIVGALGFAVAAETIDVVRSTFAEEAPAAESLVEFPTRELSPEWQWKPRGVDVEHMYRNAPPARLDWIREGNKR